MRHMRSIPILVCLTLAAPLAAVDEIWVLNESRDIRVIDAELETVTATIPLPAGAAIPDGLAFSTVPGLIGAYAFVSDGATLHVVEADTGMITDSVDVATLVGSPLTLRSCASANTRQFAGMTGSVDENHLFVAADVETAIAGEPTRPHFIVLDQSVLVGAAPGADPLIEFGLLNAPGTATADRGLASSVTVLGAPHGEDRHVRAWFTIRVGTPVTSIRSVLIATNVAAGTPYVRVRESSSPVTGSGPGPVRVGAPYDREMALLPAGEELIPLDGGEPCDLDGDISATYIAGPGPGGFHTYALDRLGSQLLRVNDRNCTFDVFSTGADPVDMTTPAPFSRGPLFIANRESDSVTVLRLDDTTSTIELAPPGPACSLCPVRIEARKATKNACDTSAMTMVKVLDDDILSWPPVECPLVGVYCQCGDDEAAGCPCACQVSDPGCFATAPPNSFSFLAGGGPLLDQGGKSPWIHLGNTATSSYTHVGAGNFNLKYVVGAPPPPPP